MNDKILWYLKRESKVLDENFSSSEILAFYNSGEIYDSDELWCAEHEVWAKVVQYKNTLLADTTSTEKVEDDIEDVADDDLKDNISSIDRVAGKNDSVAGIDGDITCPFCWRSFNLEDLKFIAQHNDLDGDLVLGYGFKKRFIPNRFTPDGNAIDIGGVVCEKRACPICHNHLVNSYFEFEPMFLSLVGAPNSGKSVFLPCMLKYLKERLRADFSIGFVDADGEQNSWISAYENNIFNLGILPEKTSLSVGASSYHEVKINGMNVLLTNPAIFALRDERAQRDFFTKEINKILVMHDNAGEHYLPGQDSAETPGTRHLKHSEAIMFVFDPTANSGFGKTFSSDDNFTANMAGWQPQAQIFTNAMQTIKRHNKNNTQSKYKRPVIVMISKADALGDIFSDVMHKRPFFTRNYINVLDIRLLLETSYMIREMLCINSQEVVNTIETEADDVIYIPISSIGQTPFFETIKATENYNSTDETTHQKISEKRIKKVDISKLSPLWVDVPLLYVLYKGGYLEGEKSKIPDDVNVKHLKIISQDNNYIHFVNPRTNQAEMISAQYADIILRSPDLDGCFTISTKNKQSDS